MIQTIRYDLFALKGFETKNHVIRKRLAHASKGQKIYILFSLSNFFDHYA